MCFFKFILVISTVHNILQSVILTIIIVPQLPQFCVNVLSYKYIRFFETSDELIQGQTRRVTIFTIQPTFESDVLCKTL